MVSSTPWRIVQVFSISMLAEDISTPRRASHNDIKKLPGFFDVVCCKERVFEEGIPKGARATHPGCHRHEAMIRQRLEHRMRQPCLSAVEDITQRPADPLEKEKIEVVADMVCGKRFGE